jgi:hypothetical protein
MDGEADYFQRRRRRAARDDAATVSFGQAMYCSFPCEIDPTKGVSGSTRAREERRCQARASRPPGIAGIGVAPRRYLRASMRNSTAAIRCLRGKAKGRKIGGSGIFIAGVGLENGLGFARNLAVHRTARGVPCGKRSLARGG